MVEKLKNNTQFGFFIIILFLISLGVYKVILPIWTLLLVSFLFALAFYPLYLRFDRKHPNWHMLMKVGFVTAIFVLVALIPIIFFSYIILSQLASFTNFLSDPQSVASLIEFINATLADLKIDASFTIKDIDRLIIDNLESIVKWSINSLSQIVGTFIFVISWSLLFILFFVSFLPNMGNLKNFWVRLSPLPKETSLHYLNQVKAILHNVVFVTAVIAALQGIMVGLLFWLLGLPLPGLFGLFTFILGFIPFLGTSLILIPTAIVLAIQGQWTSAIIVTLLQLTIVSNIDLIIRPLMKPKNANIHPAIIIAGIIGGVAAFGIIGIIIGPILMILLTTSLEIFIESYSNPKDNKSSKNKIK